MRSTASSMAFILKVFGSGLCLLSSCCRRYLTVSVVCNSVVIIWATYSQSLIHLVLEDGRLTSPNCMTKGGENAARKHALNIYPLHKNEDNRCSLSRALPWKQNETTKCGFYFFYGSSCEGSGIICCRTND